MSFGETEWSLARREADTAERLTRAFYGIPGHEWERTPHDVVPAPLEADALARIVRLGSSAQTRPLLYRIELDTEAVLRAVRPGHGITLPPLLRYVFTHEYVHMVRFALLDQPFQQHTPGREQEEQRVHTLTARILAPGADARLLPVLTAYRGCA